MRLCNEKANATIVVEKRLAPELDNIGACHERLDHERIGPPRGADHGGSRGNPTCIDGRSFSAGAPTGSLETTLRRERGFDLSIWQR